MEPEVMNSKVVKDGGGSMKSLSSGKKDSNTPHIDSGVDSGLSYRSQNSNSNSDSQCSDSASCNSTQCAQASEYTDQSSLRNIRDSEFEDSGRDSTTSSSKSRHSSRRCSEIGFSAHHEIDVPHYYPAYANVLKMKNSFFQPNTELVLYDCETGEGEMFITDENASQSAGIRLYSIKSEESCDGNILQNIHDQLHYAMATVHNLEKAEEAEEIRVKERNMKSLRLDHLKAKQILGKGGYAHVSLVECPQGDLYALKCINKNSVVQAGQRRHVKAEREILMEVDSKFILKLYKTFRDVKYVYLLTEVLMGGELFTLMKRNGPLEEGSAKFAMGCILEAIEYLHGKNIVHRDVKPENMLLDTNGYVKLADFGFAKKLGPDGRTRTFCGTPGYLAPELVLKRPHGYAADFWSIGVFLFELLSCKSPFRRHTDAATYKMTMRGIESVEFPKIIKKHAVDLIKQLCSPEPETRLGTELGVIELKHHKWLRDFDFDGLYRSQLISPIKPELKGKIDTSQFENFSCATIDDSPPDETSGWDNEF